jgi:phosphate uptake regulator
MKRKVIQLAKKTLVVSLPRKWAEAHGIKKGQEIDVADRGEELCISSLGQEKVLKLNLDITPVDSMLVRVVAALYKAGYDEVRLDYSSVKDISRIQDVLRKTWIGFEVVSIGKDYLVTKEISKTDPSEFDTVLRRLFLFLLSIGDEAADALQERNSADLENIAARDENINRFADFCRRVINKGRIERVGPTYCIVEQLEKIGDVYKNMCRKGQAGTPISEKSHKLLQNINRLLREFYELYYDFSLKKAEAFGARKKALDAEMQKCFESKENHVMMLYLSSLLEEIFDLNGPLLTARL